MLKNKNITNIDMEQDLSKKLEKIYKENDIDLDYYLYCKRQNIVDFTNKDLNDKKSNVPFKVLEITILGYKNDVSGAWINNSKTLSLMLKWDNESTRSAGIFFDIYARCKDDEYICFKYNNSNIKTTSIERQV